MQRARRVLAGAMLIGLAAAAFTVDGTGLRAESPMEFLRRQHQQQPSYSREPVRVERYRNGEGGFLGGLFDSLRDEFAPRQSAPVSANMQRVICRRTCDGAQLVLGIVPASRSHTQAQAMCAAAGQGSETKLIVEKFVPGAGFEPPARVQTASAAPLLEGRASLTDAPMPRPSGVCGGEAMQRFMTVPILNDATLRNGDVVATRDGFKVFVGKGKPPFKEKDFVDIDKRKRVASDIRKLRIADR